ncbi:dTDP-4-dehydrorhamnose 3,5-epimerase [Estrella lausannensis]|uniref:dTDP-4-dehydrorhamnose 3,5-epimerase n=1 Tax=Estrella lausannensis TaxID=483423 RepID=A0A0H5DN30_9BACT|nr:dTDP-4-dehydrorhamnose 3,5-epimerase [Estrella lausannensis]CRX37472.1 dTDP-4-dehydrorhamnose 3,5-epimerase [Estrella lausannensis]
MKVIQLPIEGAFTVDLEPFGDERGFFSRLFCSREFQSKGLEEKVVQVNNSGSKHKGTLRGLHYQLPPFEETKLVRCIQGSIFDVVLDLRRSSPTFGQWHGEVLSQKNRRMLFVPRGCAHGFITLEDDSEIIYFVSEYYSKEQERGIRYNDPRFNIQWPIEPTVISERDLSHPDFSSEPILDKEKTACAS